MNSFVLSQLITCAAYASIAETQKFHFTTKRTKDTKGSEIYTLKLRALRDLRGDMSVQPFVAALPRWVLCGESSVSRFAYFAFFAVIFSARDLSQLGGADKIFQTYARDCAIGRLAYIREWLAHRLGAVDDQSADSQIPLGGRVLPICL